MKREDFRDGLRRVVDRYVPTEDDWRDVTRQQVDAVAAALSVVVANALLDALEQEERRQR